MKFRCLIHQIACTGVMMEDELDRDWVEGFSGLKEDW
jgi:hypothetical protein